MTKILQLVTTGADPVTTGHAKVTMSPTYKFVSSESIEQQFLDAGFTRVGVSYGYPRNPDNRGYQKHIMLFTRPDLQVGDDYLQIAVINSHNGSSSVQLCLGIFRTICANGLFVGDKAMHFRFRHTGNVLARIDTAIEELLARAPQVAAEMARMQQTELNVEQRHALTRQILTARLGYAPVNYVVPAPKRQGDVGIDLWRVFNTLQERAIKGGLQYLDADNQWKRTRALSATDRVIKLNQQMWEIASKIS